MEGGGLLPSKRVRVDGAGWGWGVSLAVVNGLDVFRREEAHVSVATSPPAQRVGAVE